MTELSTLLQPINQVAVDLGLLTPEQQEHVLRIQAAQVYQAWQKQGNAQATEDEAYAYVTSAKGVDIKGVDASGYIAAQQKYIDPEAKNALLMVQAGMRIHEVGKHFGQIGNGLGEGKATSNADLEAFEHDPRFAQIGKNPNDPYPLVQIQKNWQKAERMALVARHPENAGQVPVEAAQHYYQVQSDEACRLGCAWLKLRAQELAAQQHPQAPALQAASAQMESMVTQVHGPAQTDYEASLRAWKEREARKGQEWAAKFENKRAPGTGTPGGNL